MCCQSVLECWCLRSAILQGRTPLHASQLRYLTDKEDEPLDYDELADQVTDLVLGGCLVSQRS